MKLLTAAAGALLLATAFATPGQAAPMAPPAAALTDAASSNVTEVQMRRRHMMREHGWRRGHHYGWRRGHHYGWRARPMHRAWRHGPRRHWR